MADREEAITVESVKDGLKVYDNPAGVMTNNPSFDQQMHNLSNFMHLSPKSPSNHFSDKLNLATYSRGMGALGLPGDLSSQSRFVRVAFVKLNSISGDSESESVSQFFHILGAVDQQRGSPLRESIWSTKLFQWNAIARSHGWKFRRKQSPMDSTEQAIPL